MLDREGILVARTTIVVMVALGVLIGGSDVLKLIVSYSFLAFAFRADAMLIPVLVAVIGPRLRLNTVGAGVGALFGGMITNIGWNLMISQGGAAVFIGLAGSVLPPFSGLHIVHTNCSEPAMQKRESAYLFCRHLHHVREDSMALDSFSPFPARLRHIAPGTLFLGANTEALPFSNGDGLWFFI